VKRIFWQIDQPKMAASPLSRIENYGYHILGEHHVRRVAYERADGLLFFVLEGKGHFRHGQTWTELGRGGVALYLVGEEQEYRYTGPVEAIWFHLIPSAGLLAALAAVGICQGRTWAERMTELQLERLQAVFYFATLPPAVGGYLAAVVAESLLLECVGLKNPTRAPGGSRLSDVMEYIRLHPQQPHTVESLAKMVHLSPSRFSHLFREETSVSAGAFIRSARIEKAKEMLRSSDKTVTAVGSEVGYANPYSFFPVFKRATGTTMAEYRRRNQRRA
jgi:AraC family transcriptional regulator, arabinose operon regulatory protein